MTKLSDVVSHDTPLRLEKAAKIAFPDGGMTAAGLRLEWKRGRLVIERVAGKDYTTLNHIERMRKLCHAQPNPRDFICGANAVMLTGSSHITPPGSSSIEVATSALDSRRWKRMGARYAVEWNGKPIKRLDESFRFLVNEVGLEGQVIPHTLRHTCVTWLLQSGMDPWKVAGFVGMTIATLQATYGHHHPDHLSDVHEAFKPQRFRNDTPEPKVNKRPRT